MERGDFQASGFHLTQRLSYPLFHFPRRFVGKGYRRDIAGWHIALAHQVGNFVGDHPGFATAGTGEYQAWAGYKGNSGFLGGIKLH